MKAPFYISLESLPPFLPFLDVYNLLLFQPEAPPFYYTLRLTDSFSQVVLSLSTLTHSLRTPNASSLFPDYKILLYQHDFVPAPSSCPWEQHTLLRTTYSVWQVRDCSLQNWWCSVETFSALSWAGCIYVSGQSQSQAKL